MNTHETCTSATQGMSKCDWENRGNYTFLSRPRLALSLIKINTYFHNSSFEWSIFSLSHLIPIHIHHHRAAIAIAGKWETRVKSTKINRRNVKNLYASESEKERKITKLISQIVVVFEKFLLRALPVRWWWWYWDTTEGLSDFNFAGFSFSLILSLFLLSYINLEFILHMCFTKRVYTEKK